MKELNAELWALVAGGNDNVGTPVGANDPSRENLFSATRISGFDLFLGAAIAATGETDDAGDDEFEEVLGSEQSDRALTFDGAGGSTYTLSYNSDTGNFVYDPRLDQTAVTLGTLHGELTPQELLAAIGSESYAEVAVYLGAPALNEDIKVDRSSPPDDPTDIGSYDTELALAVEVLPMNAFDTEISPVDTFIEEAAALASSINAMNTDNEEVELLSSGGFVTVPISTPDVLSVTYAFSLSPSGESVEPITFHRIVADPGGESGSAIVTTGTLTESQLLLAVGSEPYTSLAEALKDSGRQLEQPLEGSSINPISLQNDNPSDNKQELVAVIREAIDASSVTSAEGSDEGEVDVQPSGQDEGEPTNPPFLQMKMDIAAALGIGAKNAVDFTRLIGGQANTGPGELPSAFNSQATSMGFDTRGDVFTLSNFFDTAEALIAELDALDAVNDWRGLDASTLKEEAEDDSPLKALRSEEIAILEAVDKFITAKPSAAVLDSTLRIKAFEEGRGPDGTKVGGLVQAAELLDGSEENGSVSIFNGLKTGSFDLSGIM